MSSWAIVAMVAIVVWGLVERAKARAGIVKDGYGNETLAPREDAGSRAELESARRELDDLRERIKKVQGGDMQPVEAMLFGQAMTLETIFTSLARRATSQEYLNQFQAYLGMALKAQAQCRATLEALAEIKNPHPVAFVKQANISGGHQQVNNGMQPAQQAGSAQVGGGSESLPAPETETARYPTQGFFPPGAEIQTAGNAAQAG